MTGNVALSRRSLLKLSALATAGAALAACAATTGAPAAPAATAPSRGPEATASGAEATTAPAEATATTAPVAATGEKVTLRWQDFPDFEPFWPRIQEALAEALPNVTVEFEPMNYDAWAEKLIAAMTAGTAPDVFCSWEPESGKFAEKGTVLDLQPYVERDFSAELTADFFKWQMDGMVAPEGGLRYGLPHYVNMVMVYYNKQAFDEVGAEYPTQDWKFDDYAELVAKLTKKDGDTVTRWGGMVPINTERLTPHVQAWGGHMVNPDDRTECWLGKTEAQDALEWIRVRMWDENSFAQPVQMQGVGQASGAQVGPWAAGMLGTAEDGMGNLAYYANESKFDWDIIDMPNGPARRSTLGTTDAHLINKATKSPEQAWQFAKWQTDEVYQTIVMEAWGGIPVRQSFLAKWKDVVIKTYPVLDKVNLDAVPNALKEGYPMVSERFKKPAESDTAIMSGYQKIFEVGDTPVTYMQQVADEVTTLNREA